MGKAKKKTTTFFDPIKAKHYAERVKALLLERKGLNEDISEVCAEAKDDGLEPTFIRFAAQEALKGDDERNERDEKRTLYLHALGLAVHAVQSGEMSARQAAKIYKIGKSSVYKELSVREVSTDGEPRDAKGNLLQADADGEIIETATAVAGSGPHVGNTAHLDPSIPTTNTESCAIVEGHDGRFPPGGNTSCSAISVGDGEDASQSQSPEPVLKSGAQDASLRKVQTIPPATAWQEITSARDAHEAAEEAAHQARLAEARRRKDEAIAEAARLREENRRIDADDLEPPTFLKRQKGEQVPA